MYQDLDQNLRVKRAISCVYTRVLTRVQLTSGREPSSNPPMGYGLSQPGLQSGFRGIHTGGKSRLEPSCKRDYRLTCGLGSSVSKASKTMEEPIRFRLRLLTGFFMSSWRSLAHFVRGRDVKF